MPLDAEILTYAQRYETAPLLFCNTVPIVSGQQELRLVRFRGLGAFGYGELAWEQNKKPPRAEA
jgi:hypothetical protein